MARLIETGDELREILESQSGQVRLQEVREQYSNLDRLDSAIMSLVEAGELALLPVGNTINLQYQRN